MSDISERALDSEELSEFTSFNRMGLQLLGLPEAVEPKDLVKAIDVYVDAWQNKRRGLLAKLMPKTQDPVEVALALGIVWGNQIVKAFGWSWVCVVSEGSERYAVVSADRSLAIYATYFIKECLDHTTADCTVMLAFNMQAAGTLSEESPYAYASVMRSVRRIVPKR
ncbi:hypothetical protein [Hydrocarboniphaga sp.]|uniref:hypothetical protein n=1 Tax=Hydrocarboniphaga sp. TaxID=2033016 RepID=UPI003D10D222